MIQDDSIEISEEALPGIGLRDDFLTTSGRRVGVISHRSGRRDLLVYDKDDPDACADAITLTVGEADALAEFLGTKRVIERLSNLAEQVEGLGTHKAQLPASSKYVGATLGQMRVRTRTGVSIVAVVRASEAIPSPTPDFILNAGDYLIAVGVQDALASFVDIVNE